MKTLSLLLGMAAAAAAQQKPNVVLVLMDNLGWGELGVYGGGVLRGAPTPRLDRLAGEGLRLLNFNVEAQCTPSRASLLTGRYAIRTGNGSVPLESPLYGLTQWEHTMAEMFSEAGYATAMYGKWHLGQTAGRFPTDQGFDEWYGIPNSSNDSFWPDNARMRPGAHPWIKVTHVLESRKGEAPREVKVFDLDARAMMDHEITTRAIDYMRRQKETSKPFFLFLPYTMVHLPLLPHPEFKNKTKNGEFADVLAQTDAYMGRLLDEMDRLELRDNTIFIFASDNGGEATAPYHGFNGPWRGTYFTAWEGSLRAPFLMRWPGKIPAGSVSNEILHEMDLMPTLARAVGAKMKTDRVIDGVDQLDFFSGRKEASNRESIIIYLANEIYGVKWRNWKMMLKEVERGFGSAVQQFSFPLWFDLHTDPKEEHPVDFRWIENLWLKWPTGQALAEHRASLAKEAPIKPGTPDPWHGGRGLDVISVKRIWDTAPHSAFGDIIRFRDQWYCVFREGQWHVAREGHEDDGKLRVITSKDGETWQSVALIAEKGIDLRDPHLSVTADGRLMIVAGGSRYPGGVFKGRQPRVLFSRDAVKWTKPAPVLEDGHWLWRVLWHEGKAWGVTKFGPPDNPRRTRLVNSDDGVNWNTVAELDIPGGDETTIRFLKDGRLVSLVRRSEGDGLAAIGVSMPPYTRWQFNRIRHFTGGPNFTVLPDGLMIAGGRYYPDGDRKRASTGIGIMTEDSYEPSLILPSGGDNSYPGFVWHEGVLWTMYYSSHEGKTSIYLAKIRVK